MPMVTTWIDDLRAAFGADIIDGQIRAATRDGLPTFCASEAGRSIGVPMPARGTAISLADMVIESTQAKATKK